MSADDFIKGLERVRDNLTAALPEINEKMALDATAMVKDRIINTGIDSKGKSLGNYSDNPLPAYFFKDKWLNQGGQRLYEQATKKEGREAAKKKGEKVGKNKRLDERRKGISYKEWREANERPTDHVTLKFSGTTLDDVGPVKSIIEGTKVITRVGAKNTKVRSNGDNTEKILDEYLGGRYGNILEPNESEAERLKIILQNHVNPIIRESFR